MKRIYLFWLVCALAAPAFSAEFTDFLLREGFEQGIPATWTQENVAGSQSWVAELGSAYSYPTTNFEGEKRVALRNEGTQTQGFTTKLISPVINLSDVFNPILIFAHAQPQRTGDFEHLKVYYRTSESSSWVLMKEYTERIPRWVDDTLELVAKSATYQFAFEATDAMGHGVVIDDVRVRPMPTCAVPYNFEAAEIDPHTVQLTWNGSFDSEEFEIIISKDSLLTIDSEHESVIVHAKTPDFTYVVSGLETRSQYYAYVKAYCDEETDWACYKFSTPNVVDLPYVQDFDRPAGASMPEQLTDWYWSTDLLSEDDLKYPIPHVNTDVMNNAIFMGYYSRTKTTCLEFCGTTTTYLPAGHWGYAATPKLNVESMQGVEVSFWATSYQYQAMNAANGITVGVMVDPTDKASFTPVKTVYCRGYNQFRYFEVDLSSYTGEGRYVAFMSDFANKDNIIWIDDLEIKKPAASDRPTQAQAGNWKEDSFDITVNTHGAQSWNLILSTGNTAAMTIEDGTEPATANVILRKDGLTGNTVTINKSELAASYNYKTTSFIIYAQAVNGDEKSLWSMPVKYRIPDVVTSIPYTFTFEADVAPRYTKLNMFMFQTGTTNQTAQVPSCVVLGSDQAMYGAAYATGTVAAKTTMDGTVALQLYSNTVFALSQLPTDVKVNTLGVELYSKAQSAAMATRPIEYGIMTDPYDQSTFEVISTFTPGTNTEYSRQYLSLADYKGDGHWLAFRAQPTSTQVSGTSQYAIVGRIDRVTIDILTSCIPPSGVTADPAADSAVVKWEASGMTKFKVEVATGTTTVNGLPAIDPAKVVFSKTVENKTEITVTGLEPTTTYYYCVSTICGDEVVSGSVSNFTTDCPEITNLPYIVDFEQYASNDKPLCWLFSSNNTTTAAFATASYAHGGSKSMRMYRSAGGKIYTILPLFDANPQDVELTFWMRRYSTSNMGNDSLEVGVMSDPSDNSTFEKVTCFKPITATYVECVVNFEAYTGTAKYIAFCMTNTMNTGGYVFDDINVSRLAACRKVRDLSVGDLKHNGATATWKASGAPKYQFVVMTKNMSPDEALAGTTDVVVNQESTTNSLTFTSSLIEPYTTYYASVRGVCDGSNGEWSTVVSFRTSCQPVSPADFGTEGVETFDAAGVLNCWTTGIMTGTTQAATINSNALYLYSNASSEGSYAVLPQLDITDVKKIQLSFDAHAGTVYSDSHILNVGVVTNPQNMATAVVVKEMELPIVTAITATSEVFRYTVRFNNYEGDLYGNFGTQPYFITVSNGVIDRIHIDNVSVEYVGEVMEPVDMVFDTIGRDMIQISWEKGLGNKFEVKVATEPIDPSVEASLKTITVDNDTTAIITGLSPQTKYYIYIKTVDGSKESKWSNVRWATTECPVTTPLPLTENFDGYTIITGAPYTQPDCWALYYAGGELASQARVASEAKISGEGGLLLTSQGSTGNNSYAVLPAVAEPLNTLSVKLSAKTASGTISERKLYVGATTANEPYATMVESITWVDSIVFTNGNWQHKYVDLQTYTGAGKHIVLGFVGGDKNNASTSAQIYIDDLSVNTTSSCKAPFNTSLVSRGKDFLEVQWVDDFANSWEIAYYPVGSTLSEAKKAVSNEKSVKLTGLEPSTTYNVLVRAACGSDNYSEWTPAFEASTYCLVPYAAASWDFEESFESLQSCWFVGQVGQYGSFGISTNTPSGSYVNRYAHNGESALRLYGQSGSDNNTYAIMPLVDANFNELQLRFFIRMIYMQDYENNNNDNFQNDGFNHGQSRNFFIGVIDDPDQIGDINNIKQIYKYEGPDYVAFGTKPNPWPENDLWDEIKIPLYGMSGKYIVFYSNGLFNEAYIDDVAIEPVEGCVAAIDIASENETDNSLDVTWQSGGDKWAVQVYDPENKEVYNNTVTGQAKLALSNLASNTIYKVKVQTICEGDARSTVTEGTVRTLCAKVDTVDASWDFESNIETYSISSYTYQKPGCWTLGTESVQKDNYMPRIVTDNATYHYSRNVSGAVGGSSCLMFYGAENSVPTFNSYAILPEMSFDIDNTMALHFSARLGNYETTLGAFRYSPISSSFPTDIVVGYTIGDDWSTFVPVDTVYIEKSLEIVAFQTKETERADRFWDTYVLPLDKYTGKDHRVCLVYNYLRNVSGTANQGQLYIDDLSIVPNDVCSAPYSIKVKGITSHSATISWEFTSVSDFHLQVSQVEDFSELLLDTNITVSQYTLNDLTQGTRYFYRIQHNCYGGELSDWSDVGDFVTNHSVRFSESFPYIGNDRPAHWTYGHGTTPQEAFSGTPMQQPYIFDTGDEWHPYPTEDVMTKGHMYCETYNNFTSVQWLVTPEIDLTDQTGKDLMLSFDLAVTSMTGDATTTADVPDEFWVLVSMDNAKTWTAENATQWSNTDSNADFSYGEIPVSNVGKKFYVDYSKYAGKNITLAFISVSKVTATKHYLHLGNVQINSYKKFEYAASLCQYEDFENEKVFIDGMEIETGTSVKDIFTPSPVNGVDDELILVSLNVEAVENHEYSDKVCAGHEYNGYGFSFIPAGSGTWQQKLQCTTGQGCDSVTTLTLEVVPAVEVDTFATMCHGSYFSLGNERYYTSGTYKDTLVSAVTGCDSIVTLYLTISPILEGSDEVWLCPGTTYQLGDTTLTTEGTYTRQITNFLGCDSVVTVKVHTAQAASTRYVQTICYGSTYTDENVSGISARGDYEFNLQTEYGCDSIVTLHLLVANVENVVNDTVLTTDLPYICNGEELIPADGEERLYTFLQNSDCGPITLNVTVGTVTGVSNLVGGKPTVQKVFMDNRIYIIRNGKWFDVVGNEVK
ncbi:MAG: fibronectin type III domain-containing protein [Paludibacteraceae bacterium]|nr:fibronectin type III domain-containing protein [Paludibacteraceae bacterium]